jgi:hypothetical protein
LDAGQFKLDVMVSWPVPVAGFLVNSKPSSVASMLLPRLELAYAIDPLQNSFRHGKKVICMEE